MNKYIKKYQCTGCVNGGKECFVRNEAYELLSISCANHIPGTTILGIGRIFLGIAPPFNLVGEMAIPPIIFEKIPEKIYDKLNVPIWKHRNKYNHVFVKGLSPRINQIFLHIFLDDFGYEKIDCVEIKSSDELHVMAT